MKTILQIFFSIILMSLIQTGCVFDKEAGMPGCDPVDMLTINLNLTVPSSAVGTRSADHVPNSGTDAENYIDVEKGDYQIHVFDQDGSWLKRLTAETIDISSDHTRYSISTKLGIANEEEKAKLSKFKVMVLANWESFERSNTQSAFEYPSFKDYNLSGETNNIYQEKAKFNFTFATPTTENNCWMPSIDDRRAIPMFGITDEVDLQFAIDMAKYGDGPSFTVPMLRSLAKIEIVNNTPDADDITINSCKLTAYNSKGRFIPDILADENADWNDPYTQVGSASLPNDYDNEQLDGEELLFVSLDGGETFVVYIPEMDLDKIKKEKGADAIPQVELMVTANENEYGPYLIDLGEYDEEFTGKYYSALLRNHNYTFIINSVTVGVTGELTLSIDTDNWDNDDDKYYYDDLEVKFAETSNGDGTFKWQWAGNNIYIEDPAFDSWEYNEQYHNQNIAEWPSNILEQWAGKYLAVQKSDDSGAIATFNITAPERGSWTLALYSDDDTGNHWFYIERWDEETQEWVKNDQRADQENDHNEVYDTLTGNIAGKGAKSSEVKIRITASELQYTEAELSARLVMNVTTFDGRMAEVNLITGEIMDSTQKSDEDYYHIIQIPTPTN